MSTISGGLLDELAQTQTSLIETTLDEEEEEESKSPDSNKWDAKKKKARIVQKVLDILERFPCCIDRYKGHSPLGHLLWADAGLEAVKKLCSIRPRLSKYLKKEREHEQPIVHMACQFCSDEVILYLSKLKPQLKLFSEPYMVTPFVCALQNKNHTLSESTLKVILEQSPHDDVTKNNAFLLACNKNLDLDLLRLLVERWPPSVKHYNDVRYCCSREITARMSLPRAQIFCNLLLPKLLHLQTLLIEWNSESFSSLLQAMEQNQSIVYLELSLSTSLLRSLEDDKTQVLQQAFHDMIAKNNRLKTIRLEVGDGAMMMTATTRHVWIDRLLMGVAKSKSLKYFELFRKGNTMKIVALTRDDLGKRHLSLYEYNYMTDFQRVRAFTMLKRLDLYNSNNVGSSTRRNAPPKAAFTNGVVEAITNNGLQELEVRGFQFDTSVIFHTLRTNRTLKVFITDLFFGEATEIEKQIETCLELLTDANNVTVECCLPWVSLDKRIDYYLTLNRHGRDKARTVSDGEKWVRMLLDVPSTTTSAISYYTAWTIDKHQILYGLLRERPSLWCNHHQQGNTNCSTLVGSRKRKARALELDLVHVCGDDDDAMASIVATKSTRC